jgi:hypothetical protein
MDMAESVSRSERREHWVKVVEDWENSGLSGAEFCRRRDVSYQSLLAWRKKLSADEHESNRAVFQELRLEDIAGLSSNPLEIAIGNAVIRVPAGCALADIRNVLCALGAVSSC